MRKGRHASTRGQPRGQIKEAISFTLAGVLVELDLEAMFLTAGAFLLLTAVLGAPSRTMRQVN